MPFALILTMFLAVALYPDGKSASGEEEQKRIVRVWNVDTFEGGRGSRTAFLKRVANTVKKSGVYYLVSDYTVEGAEAAFAKGDAPDVLSFGVGFSLAEARSLPLSRSFAGGETERGCLAYPWCRGGYALYSLTDGFEEAGKTVISLGRGNLPEVAAALAGIDGEYAESLTAYVDFLNGKYRYLLGTQRDLSRFAARGTQVFFKPLTGFCDILQYVSVLSAQKREECLAFVEALLSADTQAALSDIGMYPLTGGSGIAAEIERTVGVFTPTETLDEIRTAARAEAGTGGKNILKFLKNV